MTEFVQPLSQGISRLQVGSIHDVDNFDTDQFSGSLRYVDDHNHHPIIEENVKRKVDKKMRKKEEENEKRAQRQREKDEKRAREQEEKERKKLNNEKQSISRKRIVTMQPISKSKAKIMMLDDSEEYVELGKEDSGKILYNRVCDLMRLEEKDYFGLTFVDNENHKCWLDNDKRARGQLKGHDPVFYFQVKFYPPEPALLQEDITRYQLCLQLRKDILSGKLPCSFVTYALLGSYTAQAELGDYSELDHGTTHDYLKELQFAPMPDEELLKRIHEQHKRHKGQPPNAADLHFLENAKKLAMYGVDIHPAQDSESVNINIGVSSNGILIYRDKLRINRFAWPKILKIAYKRKYFFIKLRPSDFDRYESTIGFKLSTYRAAKCLWKIAVEHHAFFRLRRPEEMRKRPILPRFNSTFRYTGTYTYHQTRQLLLDRPNPDFERSLSKRMTRSLDVAGGETLRTLPRPQSVEPFFQTHRIPIIEHDEDENVPTPGYAHVKKKPERAPVTPPRTPQPLMPHGVKPKRQAPHADYANFPPEPPARPALPREVSSTMNPDDALLAAIRLATDLDPNKQTEQIVMAKS
ncbi:unnamed protein product [Rotaria magnacalcarata]|uniref:FERM domain-containing protein n=1 Tax=Rotaria magnacalcarata TaxID=392030 RepID=A0A816RVG1_9BILA|nr:unnamed protein product [Rotaria magnacalcarata]CAF1596491.1 unnamed protein product [Rotaria magnacalcarata]CAF2077157.1 unnamed protein product [Rotaria magnacalcarata]CAF2128549.1 unnamed protein product [Rotaria magnacalcarata]CAF3932867.1 unnamed protein product [Rotaria magnacalcarata]